MKLFSFEKLKVWQKARQLSIIIYKSTKAFPDEEKFGLVSQMRRCSVSISSNMQKAQEDILLKIERDLRKLLSVSNGTIKSKYFEQRPRISIG